MTFRFNKENKVSLVSNCDRRANWSDDYESISSDDEEEKQQAAGDDSSENGNNGGNSDDNYVSNSGN